ncbi:carboxypeptidase-like regulatory domain-containing protein [Mucilaginibacter psychrotolerans]|uniref:Carboxypeptidase-like regulatory domain-containing protein n=1 Tax=Mucilaginibacter psychrotolerans TaxID=1524096 RepID=A0A4Y8S3T8_9SPHI|nr:carboxypeptidase-like regulatory domain-containing protein [Mucilaginibacter psychrotolerans]TFF33618.1 hypothetical protein E2R66_24925 [Mucilaginibacter psychrotolerans]
MQPIKHISIPQPCHEDWQQMTPVAQGRHCQSCCKTVVDFTAMSNAEVIGYLATHQNTCGRIEDTQLFGINYQLQIEDNRKISWKGLVAAASLSMLFPAMEASAQILPKTAQSPYSTFPTISKMAGNKVGSVTIEGKVTAQGDGQPLPGVSVTAKGTSRGTKTAADGSFKLKSLNSTDTLRITSLGYKPVEMPVDRSSTAFDISMEIAPTVLDDIHITGYQAVRKQSITGGAIFTINGKNINVKKIPFYLRWWYWLVHKAAHIVAAINPF